MEAQEVGMMLLDWQLLLQVRTRADELDMSMQEFIERAIKLALSLGRQRESVPVDFDPDDYPLY